MSDVTTADISINTSIEIKSIKKKIQEVQDLDKTIIKLQGSMGELQQVDSELAKAFGEKFAGATNFKEMRDICKQLTKEYEHLLKVQEQVEAKTVKAIKNAKELKAVQLESQKTEWAKSDEQTKTSRKARDKSIQESQQSEIDSSQKYYAAQRKQVKKTATEDKSKAFENEKSKYEQDFKQIESGIENAKKSYEDVIKKIRETTKKDIANFTQAREKALKDLSESYNSQKANLKDSFEKGLISKQSYDNQKATARKDYGISVENIKKTYGYANSDVYSSGFINKSLSDKATNLESAKTDFNTKVETLKKQYNQLLDTVNQNTEATRTAIDKATEQRLAELKNEERSAKKDIETKYTSIKATNTAKDFTEDKKTKNERNAVIDSIEREYQQSIGKRISVAEQQKEVIANLNKEFARIEEETKAISSRIAQIKKLDESAFVQNVKDEQEKSKRSEKNEERIEQKKIFGDLTLEQNEALFQKKLEHEEIIQKKRLEYLEKEQQIKLNLAKEKSNLIAERQEKNIQARAKLQSERFANQEKWDSIRQTRRQQREEISHRNRIKSGFGSGISNFGNSIKGAGGAGQVAGSILNVVGAFAKGGLATGLAAGFKELGDAIEKLALETIQAVGVMQQVKVQLGVVTGSDTEASQLFGEIADYATKSPFGVEQTSEMAILLKQSGVYASDLMDTLKMIGDTAGGNVEKMKRIANNYAQIQAVGKASMLDMRQFAYAGIPIYKEVAKELGVSQSTLRQMISDGEVTNDVMEKVFKTMTSVGGTFYNAVNKGAQTINARVQNLKDTKQLALAEVGESFLSFGRNGSSEGYIEKLITAIEEGFKKFEDSQHIKNIEKSVANIEQRDSRINKLDNEIKGLEDAREKAKGSQKDYYSQQIEQKKRERELLLSSLSPDKERADEAEQYDIKKQLQKEADDARTTAADIVAMYKQKADLEEKRSGKMIELSYKYEEGQDTQALATEIDALTKQIDALALIIDNSSLKKQVGMDEIIKASQFSREIIEPDVNKPDEKLFIRNVAPNSIYRAIKDIDISDRLKNSATARDLLSISAKEGESADKNIDAKDSYQALLSDYLERNKNTAEYQLKTAKELYERAKEMQLLAQKAEKQMLVSEKDGKKEYSFAGITDYKDFVTYLEKSIITNGGSLKLDFSEYAMASNQDREAIIADEKTLIENFKSIGKLLPQVMHGTDRVEYTRTIQNAIDNFGKIIAIQEEYSENIKNTKDEGVREKLQSNYETELQELLKPLQSLVDLYNNTQDENVKKIFGAMIRNNTVNTDLADANISLFDPSKDKQFAELWKRILSSATGLDTKVMTSRTQTLQDYQSGTEQRNYVRSLIESFTASGARYSDISMGLRYKKDKDGKEIQKDGIRQIDWIETAKSMENLAKTSMKGSAGIQAQITANEELLKVYSSLQNTMLTTGEDWANVEGLAQSLSNVFEGTLQAKHEGKDINVSKNESGVFINADTGEELKDKDGDLITSLDKLSFNMGDFSKLMTASQDKLQLAIENLTQQMIIANTLESIKRETLSTTLKGSNVSDQVNEISYGNAMKFFQNKGYGFTESKELSTQARERFDDEVVKITENLLDSAKLFNTTLDEETRQKIIKDNSLDGKINFVGLAEEINKGTGNDKDIVLKYLDKYLPDLANSILNLKGSEAFAGGAEHRRSLVDNFFDVKDKSFFGQVKHGLSLGNNSEDGDKFMDRALNQLAGFTSGSLAENAITVAHEYLQRVSTDEAATQFEKVALTVGLFDSSLKTAIEALRSADALKNVITNLETNKESFYTRDEKGQITGYDQSKVAEINSSVNALGVNLPQWTPATQSLEEYIEKLREAIEAGELFGEVTGKGIMGAKVETDAMAKMMSSLKSTMKDFAAQAFVQGFQSIGKALAEGGDAGEAFAQTMKQIGASCLQQISTLMLTAGLEMLVASGGTDWSKIGLGLALIAGAGLAALVSGMLSYEGEEDNAENKTQSEIEKLNSLKDQMADLLMQAREDSIYYENELRHKKAISANNSLSGSTKKVNDAIITPSGNVITTHPDDYLIATKTPDSLLGNGGKGGAAVVNIQIVNESGSEVAITETKKEEDEYGNIDIVAIIKSVTGQYIASAESDDSFNAREQRTRGKQVSS